jgi:hypothetical protein
LALWIEIGSAEIRIAGSKMKLLQMPSSSEGVLEWNLVRTAFEVSPKTCANVIGTVRRRYALPEA